MTSLEVVLPYIHGGKMVEEQNKLEREVSKSEKFPTFKNLAYLYTFGGGVEFGLMSANLMDGEYDKAIVVGALSLASLVGAYVTNYFDKTMKC